MAPAPAKLFAEDSDADSIATASTAASPAREAYNVEKVLAEDSDHEGDGLYYLLKWEGYPLSRATWEPPENITGPALVRQWEEAKKRVREGREAAFDLEHFQDVVDTMVEEKAERRRRRRAKRKRRGLPVEESEEGEDEEFEPGEEEGRGKDHEPQRRRDVKDPVVAPRKAIVQPVRRPRRRPTVVDESSDEDEGVEPETKEPEDSSDMDSLFGVDQLPSDHLKPAPVPPIRKKASSKRGVKSTSAPSLAPQTPAPAARKPVAASSSVPTPENVALPANMAKRTTSVTTNWAEAKQGRQRPRVSDKTPKDSTDRQLNNLSIQNKYRKYSRNEPAPNPDALVMIDPKTGKALPAKPTPKQGNEPAPAPIQREKADVDPVYARRSPPRERRARSVTPPPPPPPTSALNQQGQAAAQTTLPADWNRREMCWDWMNGTCRFTEETCRFAHRVTGEIGSTTGKKGKTCYYWRKGSPGCRFSAGNCEYAHCDTGVYAEPPGARQGGVPDRGPAQLPSAQGQSSVQAPPPLGPAATVQPTSAREPAYVGKKGTTCYYWRTTGKCRKPDGACEFAHFDTGVHAGPPGTYRRESIPFVAPTPAAQERNVSTVTPSVQANADPSLDGSADVDMGVSTIQGRPSFVHRESIPATIHFVTETDMHGQRMDCTFDTPSAESLTRLMALPAGEVCTQFSAMATAADLRTYILDGMFDLDHYPAGSIVPAKTALGLADKLTDICRLNVAGLVSTMEMCSVLVYPSNAEEWQFLDQSNDASGFTSSLKFKLLPPMPNLDTNQIRESLSSITIAGQTAAVAAGETLLHLDSARLLDDRDGRRVGHVFLMMPDQHSAERDLLIQYFLGLKCKVYHSGTPGAWSYFRQKYGKSCLVAVHPETPLWEIPNLHDFLLAAGSGVRIFSIGLHRSSAILEERAPAFECVRLFPHGSVTFITDDVLARHPEKATKIIQQFLFDNKHKPPGGETGKIAMRPGAKDWLRELALENTSERGRQDSRWMDLYAAVCTLCPPDDEDPHDPPNPLPSSHLVSDPPEHFPSFEGLWERSEEAATDLMVQWFAGWSVLNAPKYRRFVVCHEAQSGGKLVTDENGRMVHEVEADPKGWAKMYQHIGVVNPDDLLKKAKQRK